MSQIQKVVLLPGFLCDESLWSYQAAALSKGYEVQIVDFKKATNLEEMIVLIADAAIEKTHLVGFSMGGYLAQAFSVKYPEKIQSLTLVAANVGALSPKMRESRLKLAGMLKNANYKGMSQKELSKYLHPDSEGNPQIVDAIIKMSAGYNSEMYINQMMATLDREDLSQGIDGLQVPVLVVGGDSDRVVPIDTLKVFHERIRGSEFHVIERTGHYIPIEQPQALVQVLEDFLNKV